MTRTEMIALRQQGKTFQEIADMCGCSKQYIHQTIKNPPKRTNQNRAPTKAELYAQVEALTRENIKLQEQLDAEERKKWLRNKGNAVIALYELIPFSMHQIKNLELTHVDKAGYWFSFYVSGYTSSMTYCVRHTDLA